MRYLVLTALLGTSIPAVGEDEDPCLRWFETARVSMEARQEGYAMPEIMAMTDFDLEREIVKDAYSIPRFSTGPYKEDAVMDFANKWYAECLNHAD